MGPFGFGDMTFDGNMIDLFVVVSLLPFIVKVSVRTSGDGNTIGNREMFIGQKPMNICL
jgi:hypothetical protein